MKHLAGNLGCLLMALLTLLAAGCASDSPDAPDADTLDVGCDLPEIESYARYYTVTLSGLDPDETYDLTCDAEWLELSSATVGQDGILEFHVDDNDLSEGRKSAIRVASQSDSGKTGTIEIYQKGLGDYDDNADTDPMADYRIGWGYNAFDAYQDRESVRGKVIDLGKLASLDSEDGFQSYQEAVRNSTEFFVESATSIQEMSSNLTRRMDKSSGFLGVRKTIRRFSQVCTKNISEQFCSYTRMSKTVASRSIDAGAVYYIVSNLSEDKLPFTQEFMSMYRDISSPGCKDLDKKITDMLNAFGTHVVVEANVGGFIDYVATFDRSQMYRYESFSEEHCKKVFGRQTGGVSSSESEYVTSSISNSAAVSIKGGDKGKRQALENAVRRLSKLDAIPDTQLQEWFSSINFSSSGSGLDIIDFKIIPIWNLFKDFAVSQKILAKVMQMQEQSNYAFTDSELGTDCYRIDLDSRDFTFSNQSSPETSLVKLLYSNGEPIMEICEEYVPKIRTDRRIKVFYPVYSGKTSHAQGLFPGDGEGNRPAYLSFYDGEAYVSPIEDYGYYDKLHTAYYIHGNLYADDYGHVTKSPSNTVVRDHRLRFMESRTSYAVVKIGSGYWTRKYITEEMSFGIKSSSGRFKTYEVMMDGILFADIYQTNKSAFLSINEEIFGQATDPSSGRQTLWYLPLGADRKSLTDYLGNNMKALFKGQVSGFEAQFEGYYGSYDEHGNSLGSNQRRNRNQRCYIPFKEGTTAGAGEALVLTPDYTWESIVTSSSFNYYPVRLYRTSSFIHKKI